METTSIYWESVHRFVNKFNAAKTNLVFESRKLVNCLSVKCRILIFIWQNITHVAVFYSFLFISFYRLEKKERHGNCIEKLSGGKENHVIISWYKHFEIRKSGREKQEEKGDFHAWVPPAHLISVSVETLSHLILFSLSRI